MKKSQLLGVICAVLCTFTTVSTNAAVVTVPAGLNPGDEYRLAFITSTTRNASSTNIADYNAFVTGVANTQVDLVSLGTAWSAIASTATVDARDNTNTNPGSGTGVPIYTLDGVLIAASNADLWDNFLLSPLNIMETGLTTPFSVAWTGTDAFGVEFVNSENSFGLGRDNPVYGGPNTLGNWSTLAADIRFSSYPLYGLSGVLTAAVPIPAAAWLFSSGLLGLVGIARKKKAA